nr:hypothetical protein [Microbacterium barkeri]
MKGANTVIGALLGVGGLAVAIWSLTQAFSVEMKVALVGLGVTVAAVGISNILSVISARVGENADQRLDDIEKRLDNIEVAIRAANSRPMPKRWVRALFYKTPNRPNTT